MKSCPICERHEGNPFCSTVCAMKDYFMASRCCNTIEEVIEEIKVIFKDDFK